MASSSSSSEEDDDLETPPLHRLEIRRYNFSRIEAKNMDPIEKFDDGSFQASPDDATVIQVKAKKNGLIQINNIQKIPFSISVTSTSIDEGKIVLVNLRYDPGLNAFRINNEYRYKVVNEHFLINEWVNGRAVLERGNIFNIHLDHRSLYYEDSRLDIHINKDVCATLMFEPDGFDLVDCVGGGTVQTTKEMMVKFAPYRIQSV